MTLESFLSFYTYLSFLFSLAFLFILFLSSSAILPFFKKSFLSDLNRFLLVACFLFSSFYFLKNSSPRAFTISSGQSFSEARSESSLSSLKPFAQKKIQEVVGDSSISSSVSCFLLLGFLLHLLYYLKSLFLLKRSIKASFLVRKLGSVEVLISEKFSSPLSFYFWGKAYVFLPFSLLGEQRNYQIALFHELQHHRQRDTHWAHLLFFLRSLFFWNPLLYLALKRIDFLQELACDEALLGREKASRHEYACCLWEVARNQLEPGAKLVGTTSILGLGSQFELKKRILSMKDLRSSKKWVQRAFFLTTFFSFSLTAFSLKDFSRGSSLSFAEGKELFSSLESSDSFPLEYNESILNELNLFLNTEDGRKFIESALEEKKKYEKDFLDVFKKYGVPKELLAVPFVESGFVNYREPVDRRAAGIWQFIPETGRNFGLKVAEEKSERLDAKRDERLDEKKATDAAVRLLLSLKLRFEDWRFAFLAYNGGENKVQKGKDELKTNNPWELVDKEEYRGDRAYLARMMAAVLILKLEEEGRL